MSEICFKLIQFVIFFWHKAEIWWAVTYFWNWLYVHRGYDIILHKGYDIILKIKIILIFHSEKFQQLLK